MSTTPTPPPPPPKPTNLPQRSPHHPQGEYKYHAQSPIQGQPPPIPPYTPQQPHEAGFPTRTSSWRVPQPPNDGLERVNSSEGRRQSYSGYPQDRSGPGSPPLPQQHQYPQPIPQSPTAEEVGTPQPQQHQHQQDHQQAPPIPLAPQLANKSKNDLSHMLSTPDLLDAALHEPSMTHPALAESQQRLQAQLAANVALAGSLQSLEATLDEARSNTSARLLRVRGLETAWKKKQGELERRLEPWGPRELHQRLGQAIAEQEGICSALEGSFVEGGGGVGAEGGGAVASEREVVEWLKRVREGRRLVALRRERKRRWDEGRVGGWR